MKNKLNFSLFLLMTILPIVLFAQVDTVWTRRYSGTGNLSDRANCIITDNNGYVYIGGYSNSSSSGNDYLTMKYTADGTLLWAKTFNGTGNSADEVNAITVDASGNVYVTGRSTGSGTLYDYLTIKYDATGETCWTRRYNAPLGGSDEAYGIAYDNSGYVYVTGKARFSGLMEDYFTIKYNASTGDSVWTRKYGGTSSGYSDVARAIALDNEGNIFVTGVCYRSGTGYDYATIKYRPNGDTVWIRHYNGPLGGGNDEGNALAVDASGNVYVTGFSNGSGTGEDCYTIKYSSTGSVLWESRYVGAGGGDADRGIAIKLRTQNTVYITGYSTTAATGRDYVTIKYNSLTGETLWTRRYDGANGADEAKALVIDACGNAFVVGYATFTNKDYLIIKYDCQGETLYTRKYNGSNNSNDEASAITVDNCGFVYVTGYSNGTGTGEDFLTIKYYSRDVSVTQIVQPISDVDSASVIIPKAKVKNFGNLNETFNVLCTIPTANWSSRKYGINLAPLDSLIVDFDQWTVGPRGTNTIKCSTEFVNDMMKRNDKCEGTFTVNVLDYGVVSVATLPGPIDSGSVITPSAIVKNYGSLPGVNVPVKMYIPGTSYSDIQYISLDPLSSAEQTFAPFVAHIPRGTYTLRCTIALAGDLVPNNNRDSSQFTMRVRDFGVSEISSPITFVDSGASVTPKAWIHNYGTTDENNVAVTFTITGIGLNYTSTKLITINAEGSVEQSFDEFIAHLPLSAVYSMRCTTELIGDMVESNNIKVDSFVIRRTDVGVLEIIQPTGEYDSTVAAIVPQAKIKNFGTQPEIFNVTFEIGDDYVNTKEISLPSNYDSIIDFDMWTFGLRGTYQTRCYTQLFNDPLPNNDTLTGLTKIGISDVGVMEILQPNGITDSTYSIIPQVKVKNFGNRDESFDVKLIIDSYTDTKPINLSSGQECIIDFEPWIVLGRGNYEIKCFTQLSNDMYENNDTLVSSFSIVIKDYAVKYIFPSLMTVDSGTVITPKAWIYNYGSTDGNNVPVTFSIGTSYNNTKYVSLNSGDSVEQIFNDFFVDLTAGTFLVRCTTKFDGDIVQVNNFQDGSLSVIVVGWNLCNFISVASRGIKDGGAMTVINDTIYALQGANSNCFMLYDIVKDSWTTRCSIPFAPKEGGKFYNKKVKAGGALTTHNSIIYAFKGNGTCEFWSYYPDQDTWLKKQNINLYAANSVKPTKVKAGGSLVACCDSIFAFKGGNTNEFWVYDINQDTWYQRRSLITAEGKKIKGGASLTAKGCTLYAVIGGGTNLFYKYIIGQDTWIKLTDVKFGDPYRTIKKKMKDGAAIMCVVEKIYALKGGGTQDFGCYDIQRDTWITLQNVRSSSKVKAGGALAYAGGYIYAFVGGNSNQFLKYTISSSSSEQTKPLSNIQIMSGDKSSISSCKFDVSPNPFSEFANIYYTVPISGNIMLKLYNATGQLIETLINDFQKQGSYIYRYSRKGAKNQIPKGVYFLKYSDEHNQEEIKLIIN